MRLRKEHWYNRNGKQDSPGQGARRGHARRIRTKAWHPMETGWRKSHDGQTVPRNRINKFVCRFNGGDVFSADFHSGVSENPYLTFLARVPDAGVFEFEWLADDGSILRASARVGIAGA
jgi:sulfur-oxidizing protein SoxZ